MIKHHAWQLVVLVCLLLGAAFLAQPSYAAPVPPPAPTVGTCSDYAGLMHRIAGCIRDSVDKTAAVFFAKFGGMLTKAIGAFLTLGVIVYGIMLSMGMVEKVGRDTFVLLLKIAAIMAFVSNSPLIFKTITDAMDGAAMAVVSYTPPSSAVLDSNNTTMSQTTCMNKMLEEMAAKTNKKAIAPWLGVDCLLDTVIGIKVEPNASDPPVIVDGSWYNSKLDNAVPAESNRGMSRGMIFFFTSSLKTSIVGVVLGVAGFIFFFGLLMMIIKVFFVYLMGYIGVAFLVVISPLIIPLILFQQTKQYFDKWVKLLLSFAMQPVLMLVFIIFMMTAVDLTAFSGNYSMVYRIAGDATRAPTFDLNRYLTVYRDPATGQEDPNQASPNPNSRPIILKTMREAAQVKGDNPTAPPNPTQMLVGSLPKQLESRCTKEALAKDTTGDLKKVCNTVSSVGVQLDKIDFLLMAKARIPQVKNADGTVPAKDEDLQRQMLNEVIASAFFACMVVFVMSGLSKMIPAVTFDLIGDVMQSPNLFKEIQNSAGAAGKGFSDIGNNFTNNIRSMVQGR